MRAKGRVMRVMRAVRAKGRVMRAKGRAMRAKGRVMRVMRATVQMLRNFIWYICIRLRTGTRARNKMNKIALINSYNDCTIRHQDVF